MLLNVSEATSAISIVWDNAYLWNLVVRLARHVNGSLQVGTDQPEKPSEQPRLHSGLK
ncbi:hypothetical protein CUJ84_pRLN1000680 (plasmid) [Rhizobium leguminosarum]|uniref:Uncharacterized protein n=1 Tax=Rhizobium leguminosarum TaxID=384 RepID=A0A2K9ZD19_RHILE|nr:hypothetical protein CUJ84_pRLN1000680 [Rhizobium leguminosarum]